MLLFDSSILFALYRPLVQKDCLETPILCEINYWLGLIFLLRGILDIYPSDGPYVLY